MMMHTAAMLSRTPEGVSRTIRMEIRSFAQ
jgi:hypothetical protein